MLSYEFCEIFKNIFFYRTPLVAASKFKSGTLLKGNAQFVQKVTFEPLMGFKQNHYMEVGNITKASDFKIFLHLSY